MCAWISRQVEKQDGWGDGEIGVKPSALEAQHHYRAKRNVRSDGRDHKRRAGRLSITAV
jgi:hypothetical protein